MPTIKQLNTRNSATDLKRHANINALYDGATKLRAAIHEFLPQRLAESAERYGTRCAELAYDNHMGTVIDFVSANLFAARPECLPQVDGRDSHLDPWWSMFFANCDGGGSTDYEDFMQGRFTEALVSGMSFIRLHGPIQATKPGMRADSRYHVEALNVPDVIDWTCSPTGELIWALTFSRTSPRFGLHAKRQVIDTWTELTDREIITYQLTYDPKYPPTDDVEVPIVSSTTHGFGVVPLIVMQMPAALWLGSKLEIPARCHLRLLNAHNYNLTNCNFATPVWNMSNPSNAPVMGSGYGMILTTEERFSWAAPPSAHISESADSLRNARTEIYRAAFQLQQGIDGTSIAAIQRSGESKAQDAATSKVMTGRFAKIVREAMQRCLEVITTARGERYTWTVGGLRETTRAELAALLAVLQGVQKTGGMPSHDAQAELWCMLADALFQNVPHTTRSAIRAQIHQGVRTAPKAVAQVATTSPALDIAA